jgi:hypothetical protein
MNLQIHIQYLRTGVHSFKLEKMRDRKIRCLQHYICTLIVIAIFRSLSITNECRISVTIRCHMVTVDVKLKTPSLC